MLPGASFVTYLCYDWMITIVIVVNVPKMKYLSWYDTLIGVKAFPGNCGAPPCVYV